MPRLVLLSLAVGMACAGPAPVSDAPLDWSRIDESWAPLIVTLDDDGGERVTRIWLAVADGTGALRTGDSYWWSNLERNPHASLRIGGVDQPVRVEAVTRHSEKVRIDEAFAEKYGLWERILFPQDRGETHENYARLHAVDD